MASSTNDPLDVARRRLAEHAGYRAHAEIEAFERSLLHVFSANFADLLCMLDEAATDLQLAIELVQNDHNDFVRQKFQAMLTQRLHNYLASTMSLVEHARRLVRAHAGGFVAEYETRKDELLRNDVVPFMRDLRIFTQHRRLPSPAHSLTFLAPNSPAAAMESEVEISTASLLQWKKWSPEGRRFLQSHGDAVPLRPVVKEHAELVFQHNRWLYGALLDHNKELLAEANVLVIEANAALLGCTYEEAAEFTDREWAERDARPTPPRWPATTPDRP